MAFTIRQLTYFKALAEQRNFGRAAEACNISQPALSVQIKALESEMGGELVERRARDVFLTPLGREVLALSLEVLGATEQLERMSRERSGSRRSLSLGLIPTIAPYLLPGVLAALRAGDLSLAVQVRETRTEQLLMSLIAGELDVAVVALPVETSGLIETPLFQDRFLLAGSQARLSRFETDSPMLKPETLEPSQLMLLEDGHCLTDQALEVCGKDRNSAGINMGASSLGTLSRLVAAGFGYTLMPELAARDECIAAPGLCLRRFPEDEPSRTIGLVRRDSMPVDSWFDELAELIRAEGNKIVNSSRQSENARMAV
ncbi:LysR substrate-binding domain-containing protein [Heliomarina baculiformis]|uniref:LysR substrate-binding domain-containing protein n=1 Tax=Heliomarina baculiformis TaxID=2872036 RepID=UPI001EE35828|nr:LysR substrate-binding domain-containing protein [Heliomarina baculiformis]